MTLKKTREKWIENRISKGFEWEHMGFVFLNETYQKCDDFDWDFIGEIW